jgi:hypothetical protein
LGFLPYRHVGVGISEHHPLRPQSDVVASIVNTCNWIDEIWQS